MQADVSEINEFLEWLEQHRNISQSEMRSHLLWGWFRPRALRSLLFFRTGHERHLRRDVVDRFLKGESVDTGELREAVLSLCLNIGAMSYAVHQAAKTESRERLPRRYPFRSRSASR